MNADRDPSADTSPTMTSDAPSPETKGKGNSGLKELPLRVAAALTVSGTLIGLIVMDAYIGVDAGANVIMLLFVIQGLREFYNLADARGMTPFRRFGVCAGIMMVVAHWLSMPGVLTWLGANVENAAAVRGEIPMLAAILAIFGTFLLQGTKKDNDQPFHSVGSTLAGLVYVWFLSSFLVKIRHLGVTDGVAGLGGENWLLLGSWLLVHAILVTKSTDIFAYILGRLFGRTKMIPRISPGKTWEGLAFGLTGSALISVGFQHWVIGPMTAGGFTVVEAIVFGVVVGMIGQGGDLAESLLKRSAGAKDAGKAVPGFGGVLDLIDSLLSGAPTAYFLYLVMLG